MSMENPLVVVFGIFFLIMLVMIAKSVVVIPENQRGGIVRLGRYLKTLGPGLHVSVPLIDLVTKVDLDASIPGWQGLSERDLSAAVEHFVTVGSVVKPDSVVCVIEAMKVFNQIPAEIGGTISEVLVANGDAVEYGQPLFRVQP